MKNINKMKTLAYYMNLSADFYDQNSDQLIDLHHKDQTLKARDPERYAEWRKEDVVPVTRSEHMRIHQKGKPQSKQEYIKRKKNMKNSIKKMLNHRNCMIRITYQDGTYDYAFKTQDAADMLGCSRQQCYYVLSDKPEYKHYKKAKGCKLEWITIEQLLNDNKKQVKGN